MNGFKNKVGGFAFANGLLSLFSSITILLFLWTGGFWGTVNDAISSLWGLSFIPILTMLVYIRRSHHHIVILIAVTAGSMAAIFFAIIHTLLVLNIVTFTQTISLVSTSMAGLGFVLILYSLLEWQVSSLSKNLLWISLFYGLGFVLGGVGFLGGAWDQPLALAGFSIVTLLGPIWGVGLARTWLKKPEHITKENQVIKGLKEV